MGSARAIVIGSGIGGLAVAIRLAVKGYIVTVYEKNNYPGGKLSLIEKNGFRFDSGPSLFTQPQFIEELFSIAGEPVETYFSYHSLDEACRYFFENGKIIHAYTNRKAFAEEMEAKVGEDPGAIETYLNHSARLYHSVGDIFLNHSLHKRSAWWSKKLLPAFFQIRYGNLFRNLDQFNRSSFKTAEAIQIFNRFATYNGSNPYRAPGMLSLIPHMEHNSGTYYPEGGMISIISALYRLALKKGVQFHFNSPVEQIVHHSGKADAVIVNGQKMPAHVVVSNADVYYTYDNLLKDRKQSDKMLKQERSSSALIFYWGMKKTFSLLHLHNIFFSKNYREEFRHIFQLKQLYPDPTIYVNITSKMEKNNAPAGKENWFVMLNAPVNEGQDWKMIELHARQTILQKLEFMLQTEIASCIETEETLNPRQIEKNTSSFMGAIYGASSNSKWAAFLRHRNFSNRIKGLYFVGGSVHPGGGIPLCLKSAKIVGEMIR